LPKWRLPRHLGIFYMPQIYDMGPTALLPLRRKACEDFFSSLKTRRLRPGLNPRTWELKAGTLPLDHRSRFSDYSSSIGTATLSWVSACSTIVEHSQQEGFTECRCQRHVKPPTWRRTRDL
jgi:hypothetical protein